MNSIESPLTVEQPFYDVHPWRRYFARCTDMCLITLILTFILFTYLEYLDSYSLFMEYKKYIILPLMALSIMLTNAVFISLIGTTLGKFLFGVRVVTKNNQRVTFFCALHREWLVMVNGLALNIFLINFIASYYCYARLTTMGKTRWDERLNCDVTFRENSLMQTILCSIGALFYVFLALLVDAIARLL